MKLLGIVMHTLLLFAIQTSMPQKNIKEADSNINLYQKM